MQVDRRQSSELKLFEAKHIHTHTHKKKRMGEMLKMSFKCTMKYMVPKEKMKVMPS